MGLKKFFTKKTPSEEEVEANMEEQLTNKNIPTRKTRSENVKNKHDLFKAYGSYAKDRTQEKFFAPAGYESQSNQFRPNAQSGEDADNSNNNSNELNNEQNPYASTSNSNSNSNSNSTSTRTNTSYSSTNPYASNSSKNNANPYSSSNNPYRSASSNPYDQSHSASSYGKGAAAAAPSYSSRSATSYSKVQDQDQDNGNPYSQLSPRPQVQSSASSMSRQTLNSYARRGVDGSPITSDPYLANKTAVENDSYDLNADRDDDGSESIVQPEQQQQQLQRSNTKQTTYTYNDYDLNADVVQEEEYQPQLQEQELTEEQRAQMEEDEEVEGIKTDIKFLKQESVASTRNTLRMARQAEESGKNTMGMLGHQSESLYQTEKLLSLSETQERIAKEKIGDLEHYRRHILKPGMKNPFTKGKRLREREDRIKNEYLADRMEAEEQRLTVTESENRVKNAILNQESKREPTTSDRYRRDKILSQARRYQFEADEEDDAMELEIGENISEIDKIAGRLKNLAMDQSKEIEAQNERLGNIEDRTQKLDVKLRVNTDRLARHK
ncbi:hypothetical protein WICPIJ_009722 [Wickerhamomyces pijperi]|uniref:t-SNARE coiled-coil homology domain-containing protein n=1 Tax=Wickerhamomyces pijperi TaxID=599730 RepID=A0A9P8PLB1_WICPI|nr:hypothetical protein WICPIJ_009722 [Wickerhamomyces pijperi]